MSKNYFCVTHISLALDFPNNRVFMKLIIAPHVVDKQITHGNVISGNSLFLIWKRNRIFIWKKWDNNHDFFIAVINAWCNLIFLVVFLTRFEKPFDCICTFRWCNQVSMYLSFGCDGIILIVFFDIVWNMVDGICTF